MGIRAAGMVVADDDGDGELQRLTVNDELLKAEKFSLIAARPTEK